MIIDEIEGITVMVSNQQKDLEFYTEKLELKSDYRNGKIVITKKD